MSEERKKKKVKRFFLNKKEKFKEKLLKEFFK
jgi:hypothetical protein